jgi:hypothetical protein
MSSPQLAKAETRDRDLGAIRNRAYLLVSISEARQQLSETIGSQHGETSLKMMRLTWKRFGFGPYKSFEIS